MLRCGCGTLLLTTRRCSAVTKRLASTSAAASSADESAIPTAKKSKAKAAIPVSSCPAGTVLKGLSIEKDKPDPVALEDSEYPEWLWTLLDETPGASKQSQKKKLQATDGTLDEESAKLLQMKKDLKKQRKVDIKARNALKG